MPENTQQINVSLLTKDHFLLQSGTIPTGVTALGSKYPMNISNVSIGNPNTVGGPTHTPLISISSIDQEFKIRLSGYWKNIIKPNDPVQLQIGTIKSEYTIKKILEDSVYVWTDVTLANKRDVVNLLDSFIGTTGYPLPSPYTTILLGKRVESPNTLSNSLIVSFAAKMVADSNPDTFSLNTEWELDSTVKTTRLRWRSMPRNTISSQVSFGISQSGNYTHVPDATVTSTTGRKAEIQLTTTLAQISLGTGGTGYTSTPTIVLSGGGGTGASFSISLTGNSISGITIVSGGTGYDAVPTVTISGGGGSGASASISAVAVSGIRIVQQGGNYLSSPTVTVDSAYLTGSTAATIVGYTQLSNEGRVDYIRIINGGTGYTGASVSISGGITNATATAEITNGVISNIKLLTSGYGYTGSSVTITPYGSGSGASAVANIDVYSEWVYEPPSDLNEFSRTLTGFKYNIPYEIEILASTDENFRGIVSYSNLSYFQYYK